MIDSRLFMVLDTDFNTCGGLTSILKLIYNIINILRIIIPIILILLGTIDLGKAVIASDDKEIKSAQSLLIKRVVYAAAIFFIPMLVYVIMNLVAGAGANDETPGGAANGEASVNEEAGSFSACWKAITGQTPAKQSGGTGTTPVGQNSSALVKG